MSKAGIGRRLDRLEEGQRGQCPACRPLAFAYDDGEGAGPQPQPETCQICGGDPRVLIVFEYDELAPGEAVHA